MSDDDTHFGKEKKKRKLGKGDGCAGDWKRGKAVCWESI